MKLRELLNGAKDSTFAKQIFSLLKQQAKYTAYVRERELYIPVGDETTTITTGANKARFRMPYAMKLTKVKASLSTASSSGIPIIDINDNGTTIMAVTKLSIDATEKTSETAATAAVLSDTALAADSEITIDVDVAGTGAAGLKVWLIGEKL